MVISVCKCGCNKFKVKFNGLNRIDYYCADCGKGDNQFFSVRNNKDNFNETFRSNGDKPEEIIWFKCPECDNVHFMVNNLANHNINLMCSKCASKCLFVVRIDCKLSKSFIDVDNSMLSEEQKE